MAPPTTALAPSSLQEGSTATRSNSLASTASSGGASLTRRSRTRTRTLTFSKQRGKSLGPAEPPNDDAVESPQASPYDGIAPASPGPLVDGPAQSSAVSPRAPSPRRKKAGGAEHRPPFVAHVSDNDVPSAQDRSWPALVGESSRGRQTKSDSGSLRVSKARLRGKSLPRQAFRTTASSDSSSQPSPLTPGKTFEDLPPIPVVRERRANLRDSIISSTSSSLYPASTTSDSRTESSFLPYSFDGDDDADEPHSFSPQIVQPGSGEFDADDVSDRLRLLVNNNYFLPPAHAKPSPLSLAPPLADGKKPSAKPSNATFLDFFRIGKAKSKSPTPVASPQSTDIPSQPALRTTSDSTTVSGYARPSAPAAPQAPAHALPHQPSMNRVVVVRERMDDLTTAAKEAEQDLKTRGARKAKSQTSRRANFPDDIIDPTDAVDLLPQMANSLFAVQASSAFGLGIQDSIGAALLAEHLPPPTSPGLWSISSEEDTWRKALLREAVSHSLTTSADTSFTSSSGDPYGPRSSTIQSTSPDLSLPGRDSHTSPPTSPVSPRRMIGQQILDDLDITAELEQGEQDGPVTPTMSKGPNSVLDLSPSKSAHAEDRSSWRTSKAWEVPLIPPGRAETPSETFPLAPPPRRQLANPMFSISQPDLVDASAREGDASFGSSLSSSQVVRRAVSSPRLSAVHDLIANTQRTALSITPPPMSFHHRMSPRSSPAMQTLRETPSFSSYRSLTSDARYSDDDLSYATPMDTDAEQSGPRPSVTVSLAESRPSFSEFSGPSPTASAFQDALFGSCRSPSSLSRRSYNSESAGHSRTTSPLPFGPTRSTGPGPRNAVISPPPRVSSSLGPMIPPALPPPPRSPAVRPLYRPSISSHAPSEPSRRSLASTAHSLDMGSARGESSALDYAVPPVPAIPLSGRRGVPSMSLRIPSERMTQSIHSAPAPASPTAFFDCIQAQPNAMDDLDTSDDESDSDEEESPQASTPVRAATFHEPRTPTTTGSSRVSSVSSRPSLMRLGNHSTPHFAQTSFISEDVAPMEFDPRKPIANVPDLPPRPGFFSARKKELGHADSPLLPFRPVTPQQAQGAGSGLRGRSSSTRRPATATAAEESPRRWQRESLQKFDGMLLQHMQAERDRFKRIANNISSPKADGV